jgi:predicted nucleotidyltransferase
MNPQVSIPNDKLAEFCRSHGIRRLHVFGSALRKDFGPESDIDLLVEFEPGRFRGLFGVAAVEAELSALFGGRKVDVIEQGAVERSRNYIRRAAILEHTETLYEA